MRSRPNPLYRLLDRNYCETFDRYQPQKNDFYDLLVPRVPPGWSINRQGIWYYCSSPRNRTPRQGWKIHVSAIHQNAREILDRVTSVLFRRQDANFKFALDLPVLFLLNGKNWPRAASGKFMTIYPPDSRSFLDVIEELYQQTKGFSGPYILSDYRYKNSNVVFYRFGGMRMLEALNVRGEKVPMLVQPNGVQVPDRRVAYPATPEWAQPLIQNKSTNEPNDEYVLKGGRYKIQDVIAFSNAGGVYRGLDAESGLQVIIKEARPWVGSSPEGYDAVGLLKKEYRLLQVIADTGIAPQAVDLFQEWEHWFLVEEYIEGLPLGSHSAIHNILLRTRPTRDDYHRWYQMFRFICRSLLAALDVLHNRKIVFADLSTNNLIVPAGTEQVKLIDFEGAYQIDVDPPMTLYTPGFVSHDRLAGSVAGISDDYFSLGAVLFAYLFPGNSFFHLRPAALREFMEDIRRDALLPAGVANAIIDLMSPDHDTQAKGRRQISLALDEPQPSCVEDTDNSSPPDYSSVLRGIVTHWENAATYERRDRLFPADPKLFATNPVNLAYGAAGIAYAQKRITGSMPSSITDWIFSHRITADLYPPGLYVGLAGIAWTLLELGLLDEAETIFQRTPGHSLLHKSFDLFYGVAGWGITSLRFFLATQDEVYLYHARAAGNNLLATCQTDHRGCRWQDGAELLLGLAHGASGIALFFLYLYLATYEARFLEAGRKALDFDLQFAACTKDGGLSWPYAAEVVSPVYPYSRYGSSGIGIVLARYYKLLGEQKYLRLLEQIFIDTDRKYAVFPGQFTGLAGIGGFLLDMHEFTGRPEYYESAGNIAAAIMRFRVEYQGIAFPGNQLSRLSCDYGTGSAGVALFLNRLLGRQGNDFMLDSLFEQKAVRHSTNKATQMAESGRSEF